LQGSSGVCHIAAQSETALGNLARQPAQPMSVMMNNVMKRPLTIEPIDPNGEGVRMYRDLIIGYHQLPDGQYQVFKSRHNGFSWDDDPVGEPVATLMQAKSDVVAEVVRVETSDVTQAYLDDNVDWQTNGVNTLTVALSRLEGDFSCSSSGDNVFVYSGGRHIAMIAPDSQVGEMIGRKYEFKGYAVYVTDSGGSLHRADANARNLDDTCQEAVVVAAKSMLEEQGVFPGKTAPTV